MSNDSLVDVLEDFIQKSRYSYGQLAELSGLPKNTIVNWAKGRVKKPRYWQDVAKLAAALNLNESEATTLLVSSGHPSPADLILSLDAKDEDKKLLDRWAAAIYHRQQQAPFQAIVDIPHFVGREELLDTLLAELKREYHETVYCLEGMAGTGKTALAAHLAHLLRPHLPDGVLWARVGTSNTMSILSAFAEAYNYNVSQYRDLDSRSQVVRGLLASKQALIILDDVKNSEEVRHLLPPSGSSAVIITTRHRNLSITRGAHRFHIKPFDKAAGEALSLFSKFLGTTRIQWEEAYLTEIADILGHLPLAIDIAASRLAHEPHWKIIDFLHRILEEKTRLNELIYEDMSVQALFNLSYDALTPEQQDFFSTLAIFTGSDFSVEATAYVSNLTLVDTQDLLRGLYSLSLIQRSQAERYKLHPLLKDYAEGKLTNGIAKRERMVKYYISFITTNENNYPILELEYSNILESLDISSTQGMYEALLKQANLLYRFWDTRGLHSTGIQYFTKAKQFAGPSTKPEDRLTLLTNLGITELRLGAYQQSESSLQEALDLASTINDPEHISTILQAFGMLEAYKGNNMRSEEYLTEGLRLARLTVNDERISSLLNSLGWVVANKGDYAQARDYFREGLERALITNNQSRICTMLLNLGWVTMNLGHHDDARAYLEEGLELASKIQHYENMCLIYLNLGDLPANAGDFSEAEIVYTKGLELARKIGNPERISHSLSNLGEIARKQGNIPKAEECFNEGLSLAQQIDHRINMSQIFSHIGQVAFDKGKYLEAEAYYQKALAMAQEVKHKYVVSRALRLLGDLYLEKKDLDLAYKHFQAAFTVAHDANLKGYEAEALYGLAQVAYEQGNIMEAQQHGKKGFTIFKGIAHYRANAVSKWLNSTGLSSNVA